MANSYTAIPNIVPGNLTVTGKLTVSGGQIAMGKYQRQYRIQELANGQFVETVNVDRIAGTQDDGATASLMRVIYATGPPFAVATEPAGSPMTDTYLLNQQPTAFQVLSPELRVGAATPYVRLLNIPPNYGYFSVNLQADNATRDDLTKNGYSLLANIPQGGFTTSVRDLAGNSVAADLQRMFWLDHTQHYFTGTAGWSTIAAKTIYANQLGPSGGFLLRMMGYVSTAVGGGVTFAVNIGGTSVSILPIPASTLANYWIEVAFPNRGAANVNTIFTRGSYASTAPVVTGTNVTIDTSVNQPITLQCQTLATADQVFIQSIDAFFISRTGNL